MISRLPLFVEAVRGAFDGIADVQSVSADDVAAEGLVRAFHPNVVIVEGAELDVTDLAVPCLRVELQSERVSILRSGVWQALEIDLSPEAIRNVAVAALYGGDSA